MYTTQALSMIVGMIIPILVALVTKASWGGGTRAVLLALLSALSGFGSTALVAAKTGTPFDVWMAALTALGTWIAGVATHFGLWKPLGVSDAAKASLIKDKGRFDLAA